MNDRQLAFVVNSLERRQGGMEGEIAVEIKAALFAGGGLGDRDARPSA